MATCYVVTTKSVEVFFSTKEEALALVESGKGLIATITEHTKTCGCLSDGEECEVYNSTVYCRMCI